MSTITQRPGIVCRPTKRSDGFDWDTFWRFTSRQKAFNRLLYAIHFRYYKRLLDGVLPPSPCILGWVPALERFLDVLLRRWGAAPPLIVSNRLAGELFRAQRVAGEPLDYVTGDILSIPFPAIFDLVVSDGLIEHFPQKGRGLSSAPTGAEAIWARAAVCADEFRAVQAAHPLWAGYGVRRAYIRCRR